MSSYSRKSRNERKQQPGHQQRSSSEQQSDAAFAFPLKTGCCTCENYLLYAQTIYDRVVEDFLSLSGEDLRLLDAAERWRAAGCVPDAPGMLILNRY